MTNERTYQCRRTKACRAWIAESGIEWLQVSSGRRPVCKPGMCPKGNRSDTTAELLALQLEVRRLKATAKSANDGQERAISEVERLREQLSTALDIVDCPTDLAILPPPAAAVSSSVPILLCSDWHCGAVVRPGEVNGLNTYDVGIFHERAQGLFKNALKVVNMVRSSATITEALVWLGGDLIDNWLRDEAQQTQELSPTQQLIECERAIVAGLNYLLEHGDFERIIVPCSHGNHGRTTHKMQGNSAATSYEWLMYQSLQRHFRNEPRIVWQIADGNVTYLTVLGQVLRFHHGDACRYQGGIGGLTIPLTKWIHRADQAIRADHTFQGHFHQLTLGPNWSVNGSLIGTNAYGLKLGFAPERPQQLMRFIDSQRGFTVSAPILTD
jgi:hypothetical protein